MKYEIILYWSEDNHTYIIEVLEQRVVRNAREEIRVQALTHKLTQNRNFPCGNSGTDSIEEYSLSERTTSNRAKRDQFHSSDKLRTRRPGVRIPQGVP